MHKTIFLSVLLLLFEISFAQRVVTYTSTNVPVNIPDGPSGIAESMLAIPDTNVILDINVVFTIMHTHDGDLNIYLDAPNNDVVRLVFGCGQSGNNYTNTRLDDEASIDICDGSPPFTGSFRPDRALSLFDGENANGTWTFRVTDNFTGEIGTIQAWSMEVTLDTMVSAHEPPLALTFSIGQNFPNPFNPVTTLPIELAAPSLVSLSIVNILGQQVYASNLHFTAGSHQIQINGSNWSSGEYLAHLRTATSSRTVRMLLLK